VEVPAAGATAATARLLDRAGKPLPVPVAASIAEDDEGGRWETAQLALAPLAVGDYVIALSPSGASAGGGGSSASSVRTLLAFRIVQ
jgi:hypothetical protein